MFTEYTCAETVAAAAAPSTAVSNAVLVLILFRLLLLLFPCVREISQIGHGLSTFFQLFFERLSPGHPRATPGTPAPPPLSPPPPPPRLTCFRFDRPFRSPGLETEGTDREQHSPQRSTRNIQSTCDCDGSPVSQPALGVRIATKPVWKPGSGLGLFMDTIPFGERVLPLNRIWPMLRLFLLDLRPAAR